MSAIDMKEAKTGKRFFLSVQFSKCNHRDLHTVYGALLGFLLWCFFFCSYSTGIGNKSALTAIAQFVNCWLSDYNRNFLSRFNENTWENNECLWLNIQLKLFFFGSFIDIAMHKQKWLRYRDIHITITITMALIAGSSKSVECWKWIRISYITKAQCAECMVVGSTLVYTCSFRDWNALCFVLKFNKAMAASGKIFTYTIMVFNVRTLFYSRTRRSLGGKVVKIEKYIFLRDN